MANKCMLLLILMMLLYGETTFSQSSEQLFIGTEPGEIIIQKQWYEYTFMGYKYNLCRFTDHGAHIDIIATYDDLNWVIDSATMAKMGEPLYDGTPGHFYNIDFFSDKIFSTNDYGQTWNLIEDLGVSPLPSYWCFANDIGEIVKNQPDNQFNPFYYSFISSYDYGVHFIDTIVTYPRAFHSINTIAGWHHGEFYCREYSSDRWYYTTDFFETADTLTFPAEYHNTQFGIGPKEGELYCRYKPGGVFSKLQRVDYSDDYGNSFRTLVDFESNPIDVIVDDSVFRVFDIGYGGNVYLDREPGVLYVCLDTLSYNFTEWGTPIEEPQGDRCYIAYYRAYGDTLVTTYFHDFKPDWFDHHSPVMDCEITNCSENSVALRWNEPELKTDEVLNGYQVYRGVTLVTEDLVTETCFTDNYSSGGRLNYHVLAVYNDGETSKSYNIVYCEQTEGVDENEAENHVITLSPNPTNGLVRIEGNVVTEIQVCNTLGQLVKTAHNTNEINLKGLPQGVYMLRVTAKEGGQHVMKVMVSK